MRKIDISDKVYVDRVGKGRVVMIEKGKYRVVLDHPAVVDGKYQFAMEYYKFQLKRVKE